jgi:hypothetical protein
MNYYDLKAVCEKEWITEGPNSEGMAGIFLTKGFLYYWRGEWSMEMPVVTNTITIQDFLALGSGYSAHDVGEKSTLGNHFSKQRGASVSDK